MEISIHALREEGDFASIIRCKGTNIFLSTPSARRATPGGRQVRSFPGISIHALREEGDFHFAPEARPPKNFYPRPPRGGRQRTEEAKKRENIISIHALREEGDAERNDGSMRKIKFLSTPSARRATGMTRIVSWYLFNFYPRPPRGGRLRKGRHCNFFQVISIHALREEGDLCIINANDLARQFLSTPSARRATAKTETKSLFSNKLYNILHEFRRALIYNGSKNYPNHAK